MKAASSKPTLKSLKTEKYRTVVPLITERDYLVLKASIKANGCWQPIDVDNRDNVLDGHNRVRALREIKDEDGFEPKHMIRVRNLDEKGKHSFIRSINFARRHLTTKDKRKIIGDELKADPTASSRSVADHLGVDHKAVESARRQLVADGEFPQQTERKTSDDKTCRAPPPWAEQRQLKQRADAPDAPPSKKDEEAEKTAEPVQRMRRHKGNGSAPTEPERPVEAPTSTAPEPELNHDPINGTDSDEPVWDLFRALLAIHRERHDPILNREDLRKQACAWIESVIGAMSDEDFHTRFVIKMWLTPDGGTARH